MRNRSLPVLRELALFALFAALAVILTWPLAANMGSAVSDLGDPLLVTWILNWDNHALAHAPLHLFDAPMYYPAKLPLAYSENMVGIAILVSLFQAIGLSSIVVYNIAMILSFALSGYGASVLIRVLGRSLLASVIGGIFFAFCQYKFDQLAHLQMIASGWLPLMFAALFAHVKKPSWKRAALLGAAFLMNGLTNIHYLVFGSFSLGVAALFLFGMGRRDLKAWTRAGVALVIGAILLVPFLVPYKIVQKKYEMQRSRGEVESGSASWSDWVVSSPRSLLYGRLTPNNARDERRLFPGAFAVALAIAALLLAPARSETRVGDFASRPSTFPWPRLRAKPPRWLLHVLDVAAIYFAIEAYVGGTVSDGAQLKVFHHVLVSLDSAAPPLMLLAIVLLVRWSLALPVAFAGGDGRTLRDVFTSDRFTAEECAMFVLIVVAVLGSLGTNTFFHTFLFEKVEAFRSIRTPARWAVIAYMGIAVWAAMGADLLLAGRRRWTRPATASAMVVLALADVMPRIRWELAVNDPVPAYEWLKAEKPRGAVLELPMYGWSFPFNYLLGSTVHHVPLINGTSGFEPPLHQQLRTMAERGEYNDAFMALLEEGHCQLILVHADWLFFLQQTDPVFAWIRNGLADGSLIFLRRFDHEVTGDYLFALKSAGPDALRYRREGFRDGIGHTDRENLDRTLSAQATYNASTFGVFELPAHFSETNGPLTVRGWALSPFGIRHVIVRLHAGKYVYEAPMKERPEVSARWPWYPNVPKPGFELVLPKRPKGVPRSTDVQVLLVDGHGVTTHLWDRSIEWK